MKIEFGDIIKPSIDSLNDKLKPVSSKYMLVVRGSQILLRRRLQRYPGEAEKINKLLNIKDLDAQLEPVSDAIDNKEAFHEVTELMEAKLTKGKSKEKDNKTEGQASEYFAHLPITGVKKGKQNMLDVSVQRYKIEACMNIDQKVDASGNMLFLNEQHKYDFEVTYLEDNLIMFYHMDTMDLNQLPAQSTMAFRLKKCLSPEIQEFKTLLDESTALYVKRLFEDPSLGYAKLKILRILQKRYNMDPAQAEEQIRAFYSTSIQHKFTVLQNKINELSTTITKQHNVVAEMIAYIKRNTDQKQDFRERLNHIMASTDAPTLQQVQHKLELLEKFKFEVMGLYDVVEKQVLINEHKTKVSPTPVIISAHTTNSNKEKEKEKEAVPATPIIFPDQNISPTTNKENEAAPPAPAIVPEPKKSPTMDNSKEEEKEKKEAPPAPTTLPDIKKSPTNKKAKNGHKETVENLDQILSEAKIKYLTSPLEGYKMLANKHRTMLIALAAKSNLPDHEVFGERGVLLHSSLMLELFNAAREAKALGIAARTNKSLDKAAREAKALEVAFFEFKDFYLDIINTVKNEAKQLGQALDEQYAEILNVFDTFKSIHKIGDTFLKAIHEFMVTSYLSPASIIDPAHLKKAIACVRNHREANETKCDSVVRSLLNIVIDKEGAIAAFISLYMAAVLADLKDVMENGHNGEKMFEHVQALIDLYCRGSLLKNFESKVDLIEIDFFNTLARELVTHKTMKQKLQESFVHFFINKTISSLMMRRGALEPEHFKLMLCHAGTKIVGGIFPGRAINHNNMLVSLVMTNFSPLVPLLKSLYAILVLSTPSISHEYEDSFMLNAPDTGEFSPSMQTSPESQDMMTIIMKTYSAVRETRKKLEGNSMQTAIKCYDLSVLCILLLSEDPDLVFNKNFKQEFGKKLKTSEPFRQLADELANYRKGMFSSPADGADGLMQAIAGKILITSDAIKMVEEDKIKSLSSEDKSKKYIIPAPAHPQVSLCKAVNSSSARPHKIVTIIDLVKLLKIFTNQPKDATFNIFSPQSRVMIDFVKASQNNEQARNAFFAVNDFYRTTIEQCRKEILGESPSLRPAQVTVMVRKKLTQMLPKHLQTDYTFNAFIMFMSTLYLLPPSTLESSHVEKLRNIYKNYRDSLMPSLSTLTRSMLKCIEDLHIHTDESPAEALRLFIFTVAMRDVDDLLNAPVKNVDTLLDLETGLETVSQCYEIQSFTPEQNPASCHEFITQLYLSQLDSKTENEKISAIFIKHFIEKAIQDLMILPSPVVITTATKEAIDHVIEYVFQSSEFNHVQSLRDSVRLSTAPGRAHTLFILLMLCTPKLCSASKIPFICETPIEMDRTPAETFKLGNDPASLALLKDHITKAMADIIDIRIEYEKGKDKANNLNLEVVSIALETLCENLELVNSKSFNKSFFDLLCANNEYVGLWNIIASLHQVNDLKTMGGNLLTLYNEYRSQFLKVVGASSNVETNNNNNNYKI